MQTGHSEPSPYLVCVCYVCGVVWVWCVCVSVWCVYVVCCVCVCMCVLCVCVVHNNNVYSRQDINVGELVSIQGLVFLMHCVFEC